MIACSILTVYGKLMQLLTITFITSKSKRVISKYSLMLIYFSELRIMFIASKNKQGILSCRYLSDLLQYWKTE